MASEKSLASSTQMQFRKCGISGLKLPVLSLGLWHNFGDGNELLAQRSLVWSAFDHGMVHFDLANNYGPPPGAAERNFGSILSSGLMAHRDELIIATKAGFTMWKGTYGDGGSRKHLIASIDQSLQRMRLDYVDIFYHHRPDPGTPIEETVDTLEHIVRQGKALYIGLSNYEPEQATAAMQLLLARGVRCTVHQSKYSLLERKIEQGLLDVLDTYGAGCVAFSPLAQGLLTGKYLNQTPATSRLQQNETLSEAYRDQTYKKVRALNAVAESRNQPLAQMALAWLLAQPNVCSVVFGARKESHIAEAAQTLRNLKFTQEELSLIDHILINN